VFQSVKKEGDMNSIKLLTNGLAIAALTVFLVLLLVPMVNGTGVVTVRVTSSEYDIIDKDGEQIIEMEGFGYLVAPGKPLLPAKNFLIALPPGARVQSVEVNGIGASQLPGTYQIVPAPSILTLFDTPPYEQLVQELQDEWQSNNQSVYSSDQPYPDERGNLQTSGTLRKYSYAAVSFYPFSYHPQSGRLIHYNAAQIVISYDLPNPGSHEAERIEVMKWDNLVDKKASTLFVNYQEVAELYQPMNSTPKSWQDTYDYIIITTSELQGSIASSDFPVWKTALGYNLRTVLITDTEIASQPGIDSAEKIRNFLRSYYIPWGIEYVLLVGDCETIPMRYCFPDPANHSFYPYDPYTYGGEVPTDYYYADLSDSDALSWDSDGDGFHGEYGQDSPDFLAEVSIGRIPTSDTARIRYTLNKLVAFEQDTGEWKNHALHAGAILFFENQDFSGYPFIDGARCMDVIETDLMSGWTISHYCEHAGLVPSSYSWDMLTEAAFNGEWRNGQYAVVNWSGHGWPRGAVRTIWAWDDGDGVPESQNPTELTQYSFINTLSSDLEDDHPSIVFAISCNVGYPEANPLGNLGIDLLTLPGFGSSAGVLSATRGAAVSADPPPMGGGAESMCYEFNQRMIDGPSGPERVGDAIYGAKFYCNQNFGWDHYYEYKNLFDYNLYGDPALAREGAVPINRGDCNGNGTVEAGDVVYLINYLFQNGPAPDPLEVGDANCDSLVEPSDVVYLINYLFRGGPPPGCSKA
jgi:hypothetical protein